MRARGLQGRRFVVVGRVPSRGAVLAFQSEYEIWRLGPPHVARLLEKFRIGEFGSDWPGVASPLFATEEKGPQEKNTFIVVPMPG